MPGHTLLEAVADETELVDDTDPERAVEEVGDPLWDELNDEEA